MSQNHVYAAIDKKVVVIDVNTGKQISSLNSFTRRHITALYNYEKLGYTILGCSDGTIELLNSTKDMVQQFTSHTKAIISIILFPRTQLFLSCSLDMTIRMYSLSSFKEIYMLNLKEIPLGMKVLDDSSFYIFTTKSVSIWNLNHLNSLYAFTKYETN